jgi:hypothetical protein
MAHATHTNVSNFMQRAAFSASTSPTDTIVTAGIVQADLMIDNYLQGRTADAGALQLASCMIVKRMILDYLKTTDAGGEHPNLEAPLMTREAKEVLDRDMDTAAEIPIRTSNLSSYQTSANPDEFV